MTGRSAFLFLVVVLAASSPSLIFADEDVEVFDTEEPLTHYGALTPDGQATVPQFLVPSQSGLAACSLQKSDQNTTLKCYILSLARPYYTGELLARGQVVGTFKPDSTSVQTFDLSEEDASAPDLTIRITNDSQLILKGTLQTPAPNAAISASAINCEQYVPGGTYTFAYGLGILVFDDANDPRSNATAWVWHTARNNINLHIHAPSPPGEDTNALWQGNFTLLSQRVTGYLQHRGVGPFYELQPAVNNNTAYWQIHTLSYFFGEIRGDVVPTGVFAPDLTFKCPTPTTPSPKPQPTLPPGAKLTHYSIMGPLPPANGTGPLNADNRTVGLRGLAACYFDETTLKMYCYFVNNAQLYTQGAILLPYNETYLPVPRTIDLFDPTSTDLQEIDFDLQPSLTPLFLSELALGRVIVAISLSQYQVGMIGNLTAVHPERPVSVTNINCAEVIPRPTFTKAYGMGLIIFNNTDFNSTARVFMFQNAVGVFAAHIHGPSPPSADANLLWPLNFTAFSTPVLGSAMHRNGTGKVYYLRQLVDEGTAYYQVHTFKYFFGELRGNINPTFTLPELNFQCRNETYEPEYEVPEDAELTHFAPLLPLPGPQGPLLPAPNSTTLRGVAACSLVNRTLYCYVAHNGPPGLQAGLLYNSPDRDQPVPNIIDTFEPEYTKALQVIKFRDSAIDDFYLEHTISGKPSPPVLGISPTLVTVSLIGYLVPVNQSTPAAWTPMTCGESVPPSAGSTNWGSTLTIFNNEEADQFARIFSFTTIPYPLRIAYHIHGPATPLDNAGILFPLNVTKFNQTIPAVREMDNETYILGELFDESDGYYNWHSAAFPKGEIRGNLSPLGVFKTTLFLGCRQYNVYTAPAVITAGDPVSCDWKIPAGVSGNVIIGLYPNGTYGPKYWIKYTLLEPGSQNGTWLFDSPTNIPAGYYKCRLVKIRPGRGADIYDLADSEYPVQIVNPQWTGDTSVRVSYNSPELKPGMPLTCSFSSGKPVGPRAFLGVFPFSAEYNYPSVTQWKEFTSVSPLATSSRSTWVVAPTTPFNVTLMCVLFRRENAGGFFSQIARSGPVSIVPTFNGEKQGLGLGQFAP